MQHKDDLEKFIKLMTEQYKISFESLPENDQAKFKKYFEFFVDVVSQL